MRRKISFLMILCLLLMLETTVLGVTFSDMENHWAEKVVEEMTDKGILNGFDDGTFRPNESVTREQFAKILIESMGIEERNSDINFVDVEDGRWSEKYIQTASEYFKNECINDEKYYFSPTQVVTREEAAAVIVKACGYEKEIHDDVLWKTYTDGEEISEEYREYVAIAYRKGIMYATSAFVADPYGGEVYFSPKDNITRAQLCKLLHNMYSNGMINNKTIYGDLNNDEIVDRIDEIQIRLYLDKMLKDNVNLRNADVDLDGKITENDYWLIGNAIKGIVILPHDCASHTEKYEKVDDISHKKIETCNCGEISYETKVNHKFEDGKCICGAKKIEKEEIIYGDVNEDGKVNTSDVNLMFKFLEIEGGIAEINFKNSDVDLDGKITENDYWLIGNAIKGIIRLPHDCTSHTEKYEKVDDINHKRIETCKCGAFSYETKENHKFLNGKCVCESELTKHECKEVKKEYEKINDENHRVISKCECGKVLNEYREVHKFANNKCVCGAEANINEIHKCKFEMATFKYIDEEKHRYVEFCSCGKELYEEIENHEFDNGKCACGFEEKVDDIVGTIYEEAVAELEKLKIINRFEDGTFKPEKIVTRADFAKILVLAEDLESAANKAKGVTDFSDVSKNHWASGYINIVIEYGYMSGYADGTFSPNKTISYSEAITYIVRVLGYKSIVESKGTWPTNYINKAHELKLLENIDYDSYNDNLTRGNLAILIYNMINTEKY